MLLPHFHRQIRAWPWLVIGMLGHHASSVAQTVAAPPLVLRPSSLLQESIPKNLRSDVPSLFKVTRSTSVPMSKLTSTGRL